MGLGSSKPHVYDSYDPEGLDEVMESGSAPPIAVDGAEGLRRRVDPDSDDRHHRPLEDSLVPRVVRYVARITFIGPMYRFLLAKNVVEPRFYGALEVMEVHRDAIRVTRVLVCMIAWFIVGGFLMSMALVLVGARLQTDLDECQDHLSRAKDLLSDMADAS